MAAILDKYYRSLGTVRLTCYILFILLRIFVNNPQWDPYNCGLERQYLIIKVGIYYCFDELVLPVQLNNHLDK